jgi:carboxypeptidase Q
MMHRCRLAAALLTLAPTLAGATDAYHPSDLEAAERLRDAALAGSGSYELVASLTTEVGPRLAGSPGDAAAVAWAQRQLAALGLTNVRTQEVIVPQWVRGSIETRVVTPFPQPLVAVALGGSVGTQETGLEAEVVGFDSVEALRAAPREQVEGRIVYLGTRTERSRSGSGYGAALPSRMQGPSEAGRLGAAALLIRSLGTSSNRLPHTGALRYTIDAPRIPAAALANPDADLLERMLAGNQPVRVHLKLTARDLPYTRSANVMAEVPGTDLADEIVLLGAHLDSWDLGTGAIDDGAGVAIVSAAAALIAKSGLKPRRTLRVVLFANEEFGLSGANAYAQLARDEGRPHVLAMEADFGGAPVYELDSRVPEDRLGLVDAMLPALAPLGIERGGNQSFGGADLQPLSRDGVPLLGLRQDGTLYFDTHHTANDNLDKIDPEAMDQAVAAYAAVAFLAAQAEGGFGRTD